MEQEAEATEVEVALEQAPEARSEYDLHIKVPSQMRERLKEAAELAYRLEGIPKPDLVDLMNLFISWGMAILKKQWLDRTGYR